MLRNALICLFALMLPLAAWAEMIVEIDLSWTEPTQNVDGTPAYLDSYVIDYGDAPGASNLGTQIIDAPATKTLLTLTLLSGTTVYIRLYAKAVGGETSAASNEVAFGPFAESDLTTPARVSNLTGVARIVSCPETLICVQTTP
jgi:hypothetical protein